MKKRKIILICIFFSYLDKIINTFIKKEPVPLLLICQKLQDNQIDDKSIANEKNSKKNSIENLKYLQIFTFKEYYVPLDENMNLSSEEINIFNKCELNQDWQSENQGLISNDREDKIFEGEEISRRSFRIKFLDSVGATQEKNIIDITNIELITEKSENNFQSPSQISSFKFPKSLNPGNSLDFFIDYNCNLNPLKDYLEIKIRITLNSLNEDYFLQFSYIKICNQNTKFSSNSTYIFLIFLFILVFHLCEHDFLTLNVHIDIIHIEKIIHLKYAEHITIYSFILFSFLILLGILTLFKPFAYCSGFLLSLISVKFCIKSLVSLLNPNFNERISNSYFSFTLNEKLKYLNNISVSWSKIIYYFLALIIFTFWLIYFNNFILMNFIAFSVSYLVVKKIKFRNFYFILFLFSVVIIYDIIWLFMNDTTFTDTFNLNSENIKIPIRFLLPEIVKSPFHTYYFFSILDLILIGYLNEYLKVTTKVNNFDSRYKYYSSLGLYTGLASNLVLFYGFKRSFPFFLFPGICSIGIVFTYAVYRKELHNFTDLRRQETYMIESRCRIAKEYPLQIIGADESRDFNEMVSNMSNMKYRPPNVISEMEGVTEESPREKGIFENVERKISVNKINLK